MIANAPTTKTKGQFQVSWSTGGTIKRVEIVSRDTGRRTVGTDWANWDTAYQQALHQMFRPRAN